MCKANYLDGRECPKEATYGVLCDRHARQIATTPSGFQSRRVIRRHLHRLTEQEIDWSSALYRTANGEKAQRTSHPLSYRPDAIAFLMDGEKTATQIVSHLNDLSWYEMSPSKVGQLMRALMNEGTVVRRHANVGGVWGAVYALKDQVDRDDL